MDFQRTPLRHSMNVLHFIILFAFISILINCKGQNKTDTKQTRVNVENKKLVGGGCDGCELMYVGMPKNMKSIDTSAGWTEKGQKLLLTGTVYKLGGRIPAPNVVVYYWQTDNNGYYSPKEGMDEQAKKHGHIRGWIKSDENGNYSIYTIRPTPYPNEDIPAHIHLSIKEPNIENEYYADLYFDDDLLYLKHKKKYGKRDRAGTELLRVLLDKKVQVAEHNIILGLNIPNYPIQNNAINQSGLNIGEDQP